MTKNKFKLVCLCFLMSILCIEARGENPPVQSYDIVIYGGTSAGVIAAQQAAKMGKSVVLIEPGKHLGGMTASGLGWIDLKTGEIIGGLTRKYFYHVWEYYQRDSSWTKEKKHPIQGQLMNLYPNDPHMWVLEPHIAERIFKAIVHEENVPVVYNERLNRESGVILEGQRIIQIVMESGLAFNGKMFIDTSYEGDLMAASKVSYIVGREPNSRYQETLNGIHFDIPKKPVIIDPYVVQGNPESGLLTRIYLVDEKTEGEGDSGVQAYNFRMCLTDLPENRVQIEKPNTYDEKDYEIHFRAIEEGSNINSLFTINLVPNRKTDSNNHGLASTDYVGMSWDYPEADYETRKEIALKHVQWQRGLLWTLQNHHRVPVEVRDYYAPWGLAKDEFADNNHWPYSLYVRESRRMISSVVIHEQTVLGNVPVEDSIGLACYDIDSHAIKYTVSPTGFLIAEGGLYHKPASPFPISYQAIVPLRNECENLLVPVCLSASHIGYGSLRLEPTFMILGQSAATAASLAIDYNVALQDLPYDVLRHRLLAGKQILDLNDKNPR